MMNFKHGKKFTEKTIRNKKLKLENSLIILFLEIISTVMMIINLK